MALNIVITGANRGIGLAFARQYHALGHRVYAVCRHASAELETLGLEVIDNIDVAKASCLPELQRKLSGVPVDILINNAGILRNETLGELNYDTIEAQFQTNALGPLRVVEALLPNLGEGSKVANITSRMGSIEDNTSGGRYGYRMSKAALNIASVSMAHDLAAKGIAVAILHPGLVGTEMIGGVGDLTPEEAAERLRARIDDVSLETSGRFFHSNGEALPW